MKLLANSTLIELFTVQLENDKKFDEWIDPYDSIWLKIATIFVYIVEVLTSIIMLAFVAYETGGLAGHYRTLINQLLSCLYGYVRNIIFTVEVESTHLN